jgi:hypothetical protein
MWWSPVVFDGIFTGRADICTIRKMFATVISDPSASMTSQSASSRQMSDRSIHV